MIDQTSVTRRRFIVQLTMAGAAVAAMPLLGSSRPAQADPTSIPVGKTSDFTAGNYTKVTLPDGSSVYVALVGGTYHALGTKCTHRGCDVLWVPARKVFQCPCHGGVFDSTGQNIGGPPPKPLPSLTTKVQDGVVYIVTG